MKIIAIHTYGKTLLFFNITEEEAKKKYHDKYQGRIIRHIQEINLPDEEPLSLEYPSNMLIIEYKG